MHGAPKGRNRGGFLGLWILILALLVLTAGTVAIFLPFVAPLLLALVFTSVSYPLYEGILSAVGEERRGVASGLTCAALTLVVFLPLSWVGWTLAREAAAARRSVQPFLEGVLRPESIEHLRRGEWEAYWDDVREALRALRRGSAGEEGGSEAAEGAAEESGRTAAVAAGATDADAADAAEGETEPAAAGPPAIADGPAAAGDPGAAGSELFPEAQSLAVLASWLSRTAGRLLAGVFGFIVQLCLLVLIMFYFFRDGHRLLRSLRDSIPVDESYKNKVIETFERVSKSLIRGTLATALAQGAIGAIGYAIVGMPAALFWGVMVSISALIPIVGTAIVTVPIIVAFIIDGQLWWHGTVLIAFAAVISALDNLLRPLFLKGGLHLHPLWILLSILGGVTTFGGLGLVIGPMLIVFLGTFLALVTEQSESGAHPAAPPIAPAHPEP